MASTLLWRLGFVSLLRPRFWRRVMAAALTGPHSVCAVAPLRLTAAAAAMAWGGVMPPTPFPSEARGRLGCCASSWALVPGRPPKA
jgi:hypothetical protein